MLCRTQWFDDIGELPFTADGEIRLLGADISGVLNFEGATLRNPGKQVLTAEGLTVGVVMLCRKGFSAEGEVRLLGAQIEQLEFDGAILQNPGKLVLNAERLTVKQNMLCRTRWFDDKGELPFTTDGKIRLTSAYVAGTLDFDRAILSDHGDRGQSGSTYESLDTSRVLMLHRLRAGELRLRLDIEPDGKVDVTNAQVENFSDSEITWPKIILDGFIYDNIEADSQRGVRKRLLWLKRSLGGYALNPMSSLLLSTAKPVSLRRLGEWRSPSSGVGDIG